MSNPTLQNTENGVKNYATPDKHSRQLTLPEAKKLLFIGKQAVFTIKTTVNGVRFTYRINKCKTNDRLFFVQVFSGSDNNKHYSYFGCIWADEGPNPKFTFSMGKPGKTKYSANDLCVQYFVRFMQVMYSSEIDNMTGKLEFWHEGHCLKCGKRLTVPESISLGIGPECFKMMGHKEYANVA